ncbi:MAG: UDP-N-acetylmuramoyl-L-alanyl-D-glutamate--2,6-diaminopimelate ligase, partial [Burkholderiales bacterium]
LDYHGSMEDYAQAKMRLFDWPTLTHAIVNLDDVVGVRISQRLRGRKIARIGFSASGTAALVDVDELLVARDVRYEEGGLAFRMVGTAGAIDVRTPFVGAFNVANLLAVTAVLLAQGVAMADVPALVQSLTPVAGRMQRLGGGPATPIVLVDYAHTPEALECAIAASRELADARGGALAVLFGCGGDRDRGKRPEMGRIAARHADRVVVTSDNPRTESPAAILAEIEQGMHDGGAVRTVIADRRAAIDEAIATAAATDVVLIAGKGHEGYQDIGGIKHPFSDVDEAARALDARRPQ